MSKRRYECVDCGETKAKNFGDRCTYCAEKDLALEFEDGYEKHRYTAEGYIQRKCDGSDYDRGAIETAQAAASNAGDVLGRLVQVLYDKGVISKDDVYKIGRATNESHKL
jgi:predicted ATP-dependent serine protease